MTYHNTTNETDPKQLRLFEVEAQTQDNIVLNEIKKLGGSASPSMVLKSIRGRFLLTSVRRAITNLTKAQKLVKTEKKAIGNYGRKENIWQVCN